MKEDNAELIARLADEYVLGTMRDPARRRFERVMESREEARRDVRLAEDRMLGLSLALEPVQPAPASWDAIAAKLGISRPRVIPQRQMSTWRMALAAGVAMLAIGVAWVVMNRAPEPTATASLAAENGAPIWSVATYADGGRLRVAVKGTVKPEPGRSYELWALPEGGAPVSLGLMPESGELARDLGTGQLAALRAARKVAVSLEPAGGSTTGAPTGPVLYVADLRPG